MRYKIMRYKPKTAAAAIGVSAAVFAVLPAVSAQAATTAHS